eukprot:scpid55831/ scgid9196/ 
MMPFRRAILRADSLLCHARRAQNTHQVGQMTGVLAQRLVRFCSESSPAPSVEDKPSNSSKSSSDASGSSGAGADQGAAAASIPALLEAEKLNSMSATAFTSELQPTLRQPGLDSKLVAGTIQAHIKEGRLTLNGLLHVVRIAKATDSAPLATAAVLSLQLDKEVESVSDDQLAVVIDALCSFKSLQTSATFWVQLTCKRIQGDTPRVPWVYNTALRTEQVAALSAVHSAAVSHLLERGNGVFIDRALYALLSPGAPKELSGDVFSTLLDGLRQTRPYRSWYMMLIHMSLSNLNWAVSAEKRREMLNEQLGEQLDDLGHRFLDAVTATIPPVPRGSNRSVTKESLDVLRALPARLALPMTVCYLSSFKDDADSIGKKSALEALDGIVKDNGLKTLSVPTLITYLSSFWQPLVQLLLGELTERAKAVELGSCLELDKNSVFFLASALSNDEVTQHFREREMRELLLASLFSPALPLAGESAARARRYLDTIQHLQIPVSEFKYGHAVLDIVCQLTQKSTDDCRKMLLGTGITLGEEPCEADKNVRVVAQNGWGSAIAHVLPRSKLLARPSSRKEKPAAASAPSPSVREQQPQHGGQEPPQGYQSMQRNDHAHAMQFHATGAQTELVQQQQLQHMVSKRQEQQLQQQHQQQ